MENFIANTKDIECAVADIICAIGENAFRPGLRETPERVARMCRELFRGYDATQKPAITTFENGFDGISYTDMIIDTGEYHSMCEHHLMPFFGRYWFAYIPNESGRILGLSKIGRVVDWCAARLQVQERLCRDIVETLRGAVDAEGVPAAGGFACVLTGEHLCKTMRGARKSGTMTSMYFTGAFRDNIDTQRLFLERIKTL